MLTHLAVDSYVPIKYNNQRGMKEFMALFSVHANSQKPSFLGGDNHAN